MCNQNNSPSPEIGFREAPRSATERVILGEGPGVRQAVNPIGYFDITGRYILYGGSAV